MTSNYNVIDLFSGCGGFSKGFEQAGYNILIGIDNWKDAITTYKNNHENAKTINDDITGITGQQILDYLDITFEDVDVIIGGPPCQGFSLSGKRTLSDPRNILYKSFVDIVNYIRPKAFVMENVPGLVSLFKGEAKNNILNDFQSIGYNVNYKILNASNFGVPQNRKRVFFVGIKEGTFKFPNDFFDFPNATHGPNTIHPYITSKEAIDDLPLLDNDVSRNNVINYPSSFKNIYQKKMRENSQYIYNHIPTIHKKQTKDIISMVPDGGSYKDLPHALQQTRKVNIAWTRMNSMKPCFTIDTGHNHHFHYKANRVPTVRESARIQSFPDNFIFYGTKTSQLKQVGNAVPPLLAKNIAVTLKNILRSKEDLNV